MLKTIARVSLFLYFIILGLNSIAIGQDSGSNIGAELVEFAHNPKGWPALHYAIDRERPDIAEAVLQLYPEQATSLTPTVKLVRSHLGNNADQDYDFVVGYEAGVSALELAIQHGYVELSAHLIELGANPRAIRTEQMGHWDNLWYEKDRGYRREWVKFVDVAPTQITSMLYHAIKIHNEPLVELLLQHEAPLQICYEINKPNKKQTALQVAADLDNKILLRKLIYTQAMRTKSKMLADEHDVHDEIVDVFLRSLKNKQGWPGLHYALSIEDYNAFCHLLEFGEDPSYQGLAPASLYDMALKCSDSGYLFFLLEHHTRTDEENRMLLELAIKAHHSSLVGILLVQGVRSPHAMEIAAQENDSGIARQLLFTDPDMHLSASQLIQSIKNENEDLIHILINTGKLPPMPEYMEQAIKTGNEQIVKLLISYGFTNPNAVTLAIQNHKLPIVNIFLLHGFFDSRAWMACVENNELAMLRLLVQYRLLAQDEKIALQRRAIELKHSDILAYLMSLP